MPRGEIGHDRRSKHDVRRPGITIGAIRGVFVELNKKRTHASLKHPPPPLSALAPHIQFSWNLLFHISIRSLEDQE